MGDSNDAQVIPDLLERESLAWVNRLLSGSVTEVDAEAFRRWRALSPAHEQAFAEAIRFQRAVRNAIRLGDAAPQTIPLETPGKPTRRMGINLGRRALIGGGLAAASVGVMVVQPPDHLWPSLAEFMSDYHTGTGEQREVAPAPGVAIILNTQTALARAGTPSAPGATLLSGEAEVQATRADGRPFTLVAGAGRTLIDQARLNIRSDGAQVCITCLSGAARVLHPKGEAQLAAGQALTYSQAQLNAPETTDIALATAWRRGLLIFRNAPLQRVIDELNRYRPGRILLVGPALAQRPVYAVFQIRHLKGAVAEVQSLTGAKVTRLPGRVVLLS